MSAWGAGVSGCLTTFVRWLKVVAVVVEEAESAKVAGSSAAR